MAESGDADLARLAEELRRAGVGDGRGVGGGRCSRRLAAARALCAAGAAAAPHAGALAAALADGEDWQLRAAAAKALGGLCALGRGPAATAEGGPGAPLAPDALAGALSSALAADSDDLVREAAAEALGHLGALRPEERSRANNNNSIVTIILLRILLLMMILLIIIIMMNINTI